jgi:hypothetical protein
VGLLIGAAALGCGGGDDADDDTMTPAGEACSNAGQIYTCRTRNGMTGNQVCTSDGVLGPCEPRSSLPPTGGTGSSSRDASVGDAGGRGGQGGNAGSRPERDAGTEPKDAGDTDPPMGDERCDNGVDDDGDGDTDCADDDCEQRECLQGAPAGWMGPTALRIGTSVPAACAGDYDSEVARGGTSVTAAAATCSACTCTPQTPGCANYVEFATSSDTSCGSAPVVDEVLDPCGLVTSSSFQGLATASMKMRLPVGAPTCTPSAQMPTTAAPQWQLGMLACKVGDALEQGGCSSGKLCSPERPADASVCIVRAGDHACPSGDYSERRLLYTAIDDTRACSACNCAQDCNYGFKVFADADTTCAGAPVVPLTGLGTCVSVAPTAANVRVGLQLAGTGACAAGGGTPTGGAAPSGALTACCIP